MKNILLTTLLASLAGIAGLGFTQDGAKPVQGKPSKPAEPVQAASASGPEAVTARQKPSYPLTTCPISGEAIAAGEGEEFVHEGRFVRTCCKRCVDPAKKDIANIGARIDAAVIAAQKPIYPLDVCPVSGEELGSMGEPLDVVEGTRLVRLCCKGCKKELDKNPAQALEKIDAALVEAQKKTYPLTTCVVSGEELVEGEAVDHLYGVTLIRFCCKGCLKELRKQPEALVAKVKSQTADTGGAK